MPHTVPPYRERKVKSQPPNRWAIGFIILFFISSLVLLFFQSPLSKIQHIEIEGNITMDETDILEQISLAEGMQFFEWDHQMAKDRLMKNVQVKDVNVTKSFPGKITIKVTEWHRVAFWLQSQEAHLQQLRPVLEDGTILSDSWAGKVDRPLLRDWEDAGAIKKMSAELARVKPEVLRSVSEIHQQESDMYDDEIRVFMDEGNEVITRISTFKENIHHYSDFVEPGQKGIVHMTYGEKFGWFEPYVKKENKGKKKKEDEQADT